MGGTKARSINHHKLTDDGFVKYSSRILRLERADVAKFVIGEIGDGIILTLERQPRHNPSTYIQELGVDRGDFGDADERIHPTGPAYRIDTEIAGVLLREALSMGMLPGGDPALDLYNSFFNK